MEPGGKVIQQIAELMWILWWFHRSKVLVFVSNSCDVLSEVDVSRLSLRS